MEYRRVISYLYEYRGEAQGHNAGFVRLEVRNGQCRIRIFLKGGSGGQKVGRAALFRCGSEPGRVPLGTMPVRATGAEGVFLTQSQNVAGSGLPLGEFCGVGVFPDGSGQAYCSFWDDRRPWETPAQKEEQPEPVPERAPERQPEGPAAVPGEQPEPSPEEMPEGSPEPAPERVPGEQPEPSPGEMPGPGPEESPELLPAEVPEEIPEPGLEEVPGQGPEECLEVVPERSPVEVPEEMPAPQEEAAADMAAQSLELLGAWTPETSVTWNQLWNTYPKYQPFGLEDPWEVLRISIQDIGRLPREYWHLGSNEFLISGYCTYRHLLLIRDGQEELYYVGVPGDSMAQDRYMAERFGFRQYRPAEQIGYWLFRIKL